MDERGDLSEGTYGLLCPPEPSSTLARRARVRDDSAQMSAGGAAVFLRPRVSPGRLHRFGRPERMTGSVGDSVTFTLHVTSRSDVIARARVVSRLQRNWRCTRTRTEPQSKRAR